MVLPEGTPTPGSDRPRLPRLAMVAGAVLVGLVTLVIVGQLTVPGEEAVPDTTTSTTEMIVAPTTTTTLDLEAFTIADLAQGDRFTWFNAPSGRKTWPLALVEHDGSFYLFGSQTSPYDRQSEGGGMEAWVSDEGIGWGRLGAIVGPEYTVADVMDTELGMVALGTRVSDGSPFAWTSVDGSRWTASPLPLPDDVDPTEGRAHPAAAVSHEGKLVVVGGVYPEPYGQLASFLPDDVPHVDYRLQVTTSGGGGSLSVAAPLGIAGFAATFEELGLPDDVIAALRSGGYGDGQELIWTSSDATSWSVDELDIDGDVNVLVSQPDGSLLAAGWNRVSAVVWLSEDGVSWTDTEDRPPTQVWGTWGDSLIAHGPYDLYRRPAEGVWEPIGIGPILPDQLDWLMSPIAAGPGGLAVVARAWNRAVAETGPSPVIIEVEGGHTLTIDPVGGRIEVESAEGWSSTVSIAGASPSHVASVDFAKQIVMFTDPEDADSGFSVPFATLAKAEQTLYASPDLRTDPALLFTTDGETWSVQDLARDIGEGQEIAGVVVSEDRILLLTYPRISAASVEPPRVTMRVARIR